MRECEFNYYKEALMASLECLEVGLDYTDEQHKDAVECLVAAIENKSMAFGDDVALRNRQENQSSELANSKEGIVRKNELIRWLSSLLDRHVNKYRLSDEDQHNFKMALYSAEREARK